MNKRGFKTNMPLTAEQAAAQVASVIASQKKPNAGNILDDIIGVAVTQAPALQAFFNDLLTKKGILNASDEATLNTLLAQQAAEQRQRQQTRTKSAVVIGLIAVGAAVIIFFAVKKKVNKS